MQALRQPQVSATSERFTVELASAASVAELEAWLADAAVRGQCIYASGVDLPIDTPGVQLVKRWIGQDLVHAFRRRHPGDPRRWQFLIEKAGMGVPGKPVTPRAEEVATAPRPNLDHKTRRERNALLAYLRRVVSLRQACPSNAELAKALDMPMHSERARERSRRRVRYLLGILMSDGAIALEGRGRNAPRGLKIGCAQAGDPKGAPQGQRGSATKGHAEGKPQ